jgi:3-oxoadipate enol-lactonase
MSLDNLGRSVACCGSGPPVVFVHGFPLHGGMWHETTQRLAAHARCIVPDLRGYGRSRVVESATISDYADDAVAALDREFPNRSAVFVGLSMGGIVLYDVFRRHSSRVRALVLADTRANAESAEGVTRRGAVAQRALREGSRAIADTLIPDVLARGGPAVVRAEVHAMMVATDARTIAAGARALALRPDSEPTLAAIDCPTLYVVGDQDALMPPDSMRAMHEKTRGSQFVEIAAAGHVPPLEQPDAFAATLLDFLARANRDARV